MISLLAAGMLVGLATANPYLSESHYLSMFNKNADHLSDADIMDLYHDFANNTKAMSYDGTGLKLHGLVFGHNHTILDDLERYAKVEPGTFPRPTSSWDSKRDKPVYLGERQEPGCQDASCYTNQSLYFEFTTTMEEQYASTSLCNKVLRNTPPSVFGVVSLLYSNFACTSENRAKKLACQGAITLSATVSGQFVGPGLGSTFCSNGVTTIKNQCSLHGGRATCTTTNGQYKNFAEIIVKPNTYQCESSTSQGKEECSVVDCDGQCQG